MKINQQEHKQRLEKFLTWFNDHITGRERAEGQVFLERLFQAFGNAGVLESGAVFEKAIKKRKKNTTAFADLVWKPRVIIELKKRGEKLEKHYDQAFEYWLTSVPNRPQYMILCNFDEFWIYDLNVQLNDPVHKLKTSELLDDWGALTFLFPAPQKPVFNNNNVEVTEDVAKIVGSLYMSLTDREVTPDRAQRFVLQLVVALFSEDVELIPKYTLMKLLEVAISKPVMQKELTELFDAMSTELIEEKSSKHRSIPYFNGGIFKKVEPVELNFKELDLLYEASKYNWQRVRPSIFGSIFEGTMDPEKRHGHGVHFTSELDIQKIVGPTIIKPFRSRLTKAKSKKEKTKILNEIYDFKVLDPACGSGNFLYIAFRELRRLEAEILDDFGHDSKQIRMSHVDPKNFYGIDTNTFAIELAKVALSIGRKMSADELGIVDNVLPFADLDKNFIPKDALTEATWPSANAIIGNPPFLGSRKMRDSGFTENYIKQIWALYPGKDFPKNADYCCYWFRKAQDHDAKYVGLVGSNSITQNESRKASLDYVTKEGGVIHNAISTQPWSGDAVVHVSIVNWHKGKWNKAKFLDGQEVEDINSSLSTEFDVTKASKLKQNKNICFQGVVPVGKFEINEDTAQKWIKDDERNSEVIKIFYSGNELTEYCDYKGSKYIIDFFGMSVEEASTYSKPFEHVKKVVKPQRDNTRGKEYREKWWLFGRPGKQMRTQLAKRETCFAMPGHSKWFIPVVVPSKWLPYVNSSFVIASDDFYLLGILTSKLHRDWINAQSSTLKSDTRYTNTTCFETFPFIWSAGTKKKNAISEVTRELDQYRTKLMKQKNFGITKLYNDFFDEPMSQLFQLHHKLDKLVCETIYNFKYEPARNYNAELFALNQKMAEDEIAQKGLE